MSLRTKILFAWLLIVLGVAARLLPHFWNFAPITAIALFSGAYLGRRWGAIVPIVAMFLGDLFIGFYEWPLMITVYSCFAVFGLAGGFLSKVRGFKFVFAFSIIASVSFFILTNLAVWQFSPWYAKTFAGLLECYISALPFYRNTLVGDIFYTFALFGSYEAIRYYSPKWRLKAVFSE